MTLSKSSDSEPIRLSGNRSCGRETENDILNAWLVSGNWDAIQGYILGRYDVLVDAFDLIKWWCDRTGHQTQPRIWLKSRLIDNNYLPAESIGAPQIRLTVTLHFDPWSVEMDEPETQDFTSVFQARELYRPAFFRERHRAPLGITRAARKLVRETLTDCPFCRLRFRNPHALVLHLEEAHDGELAPKYAKNPGV